MKNFQRLTKLKKQLSSKDGIKNLLSKNSFVQISATAIIASSALFISEATQLTSFISKNDEQITLSALPIISPTIKYGFALDTFNVIEKKVESDDVFVPMLMKRGLSHRVADSLTKQAKQYYDFDKIINGKPYTILMRDPRMGYDYFIYEPD
jgi:hypothetical protein